MQTNFVGYTLTLSQPLTRNDSVSLDHPSFNNVASRLINFSHNFIYAQGCILPYNIFMWCDLDSASENAPDSFFSLLRYTNLARYLKKFLGELITIGVNHYD